jgi:hypothetical protein
MAKHGTKEETPANLIWECLNLAAASEELTKRTSCAASLDIGVKRYSPLQGKPSSTVLTVKA